MVVLRLPSSTRKKAPPSPTFPLPPELLLLVFGHIRHDSYNFATSRAASAHLSPISLLAPLLVAHAVPAQGSLALLARVCEPWAAVVSAVLYEFPVLTSVGRMHRLALSLRAHPSLAALVSALVLLDVTQERRWYQVSYLTNKTVGRGRAQQDLHDLTQMCPALKGYHASFDRPLDTIFCTLGLSRREYSDLAPALIHDMRYLTFDGYWTFSHIGQSLQSGECALPNVVELTLKDVHVGGLCGASLPMLRKLSMTNCIFASNEPAWLLPTDAPTLVEATVIDTRLSTTWDVNAGDVRASLLVHADRLQKLTLGGLTEWELFRSTDWRPFVMLRTLRASLPGSSERNCSSARLPEGLESCQFSRTSSLFTLAGSMCTLPLRSGRYWAA